MIMTKLDIARQRLHNQHIARAAFEKPGQVVAWLGAVQAQDYLGALWAVGLRTLHATEKDLERAIADKTIVRTWPMRGTLHFVASADARWMLKLLTPRITAGRAKRLHQHFGLDEETFARSGKLFVKALQGGRQLTRGAMYELLERARISTSGGRGLHILSQLAQEGLICFGAREGKQPTFTLLEEWAPEAKTLERDEALAELARRYFTSHGPATLQDFVWWSGLKVSDARLGLEMSRPHLLQEIIDGASYWFSSSLSSAKAASPTAHLLPSYDEYTVAYKDRSAALDPTDARRMISGNGVFSPVIVVDGRVRGIWKRAIGKDAVVITRGLFDRLSGSETRAVEAAARRYEEFIGAPVRLS
jgi:hypothetical protein